MTGGDARQLNRREFLGAGLAAMVAPGLSRWPFPASRVRRTGRVLAKRPLGDTGERVTMLGLGGQILLQTPGVLDQAVALINRAIDLGINYCDTAAAYYPSEASRTASPGSAPTTWI